MVNHLILNIIIEDFRRSRSTKFLLMHITDNLSWLLHTSSLVNKVKQHLHFLQRMGRASLYASNLWILCMHQRHCRQPHLIHLS